MIFDIHFQENLHFHNKLQALKQQLTIEAALPKTGGCGLPTDGKPGICNTTTDSFYTLQYAIYTTLTHTHKQPIIPYNYPFSTFHYTSLSLSLSITSITNKRNAITHTHTHIHTHAHTISLPLASENHYNLEHTHKHTHTHTQFLSPFSLASENIIGISNTHTCAHTRTKHRPMNSMCSNKKETLTQTLTPGNVWGCGGGGGGGWGGAWLLCPKPGKVGQAQGLLDGRLFFPGFCSDVLGRDATLSVCTYISLPSKSNNVVKSNTDTKLICYLCKFSHSYFKHTTVHY